MRTLERYQPLGRSAKARKIANSAPRSTIDENVVLVGDPMSLNISFLKDCGTSINFDKTFVLLINT